MRKGNQSKTGDALRIIGLFKQLQDKQLVQPDVGKRKLRVYADMLPPKKKARHNWAKNAYIYMAYLVGDGFDTAHERVVLEDMETGQELLACIGGEVE